MEKEGGQTLRSNDNYSEIPGPVAEHLEYMRAESEPVEDRCDNR